MSRSEPVLLDHLAPPTARLRGLAPDRAMTAGLALATSAAAGLLTAFVAPRGPTGAGQALLVMGLALGVGVLGGALTRTRWIIVPAVLVQIAVIELARLDVASPTIRDLRFDSAYGIIAIALTRGVHGVLIVLPMTLGVLVGIGRRRRRGDGHRPPGRPIGTTLLAIAVVGLAVAIGWPPSTPAVLGADGRPVAGSIAELSTIRLGGRDQTIMIRAASPDRPVLLYLSGGPGQSDLALSRALTTGWVHDMVFVDLDQRGNGASYAAIDPLESMTLDRAVSDVVELSEILRQRFDEPRIYLMGESWGTILGVLAVQRRPDLFYAWIGSGQMVDVVETDRRIYADLVTHAATTGDEALAAKLREIGAPPYRDIPWANANLLAWYELLYPAYTPSVGYRERGDASGLDPFGILGSEYGLIEKTNVLRGLIDTFAVLYPQLYGLDLRRDAARLEVPVWILDGAAELAGRRDLAREWFVMLQAPSKQLVTYEDAAHAVAFEQADEVQKLFKETIVPATYRR